MDSKYMRTAHRVWFDSMGTTGGTMWVRHCNCLTTCCAYPHVAVAAYIHDGDIEHAPTEWGANGTSYAWLPDLVHNDH